MHATTVVVGLPMVMLFAQAALSLRLQRLRVQIARLEGRELDLFRFIIDVRKATEKETRAIREEFSLARVNDSIASIRKRRAQKRVTTGLAAQLTVEPGEQRSSVEASASTAILEKPTSQDVTDDEKTTLFTSELLRGALHQPQVLSQQEEATTQEGEANLVTVFEYSEKEGVR